MKKLLLFLLILCPVENVLALSGILKQSTAVNVTVVMIDSTDHVTGKTLLTLTVRESKAGGAFATITPTVTELENGLYKLAFTTTHTDTLGELRLRVTAAGADESDPVWQVVSMMPSDTVPLITDRIDYQKGHHSATGNTFYVNGTTGNDSTGTGSRTLPYKTISKALTQCVAFNHDLIMLQPDPAGGPTTITESATIPVNVSYVQIRGPGRDVNVTQTAGANRDVFSITVSGVELSGFRITTNGNSSNGVTVSSAADFVRMSKLWIENAHQDAIQFNVANRCEVFECEIVAAGRDGVRVTSGAGSGQYTRVTHNLIRNCVGSGVNLQGSDAGFCRIQNNVIRDNAVAVTVSAGANNTTITDNRFVGNTATIADGGTGTFNQWNIFTTDANGDVTFNNTTIATVTNLTNLPSIPNNWITAAGIAGSALNGKGDWNIGKTGYSLISAYDPAKVDPHAVTLPGPYTGQQEGALIWKIGNRPNQ